MPYILKEHRPRIDRKLNPLRVEMEAQCTPGELNYILTQICQQYIASRGKKYTHMNDVVGALECCKLEMYRRLIAPYEDGKKESAGDVYYL